MANEEYNTEQLSLSEREDIRLGGGHPVETEVLTAKDSTAIVAYTLLSTIKDTEDEDFGVVIPIGDAFDPATHYIAGISYTAALATETGKKISAFTTGKFDQTKLANADDVTTAVVMACKDAGILFGQRVK